MSADKGYDSDWFADALITRNIQPYLVPRRFKFKVRHLKTRPVDQDIAGRLNGHMLGVTNNDALLDFMRRALATYDAFVTTACIRFYLRKLHKNILV